MENTELDGIRLIGARPTLGQEAAVVVPKDGVSADQIGNILPGSGIVACADPHTPSRILVYYEGNAYGAENLREWDQRVISAYGRMAQRYPTTAMSSLPADLFDVVGTTNGTVVNVIQRAPVEAWTDAPPSRRPSP